MGTRRSGTSCFFGAVAYSIYQMRRFREFDGHTTIRDFCALAQGLPSMKGTDNVEEVLKAFIAKMSGMDCIVVSSRRRRASPGRFSPAYSARWTRSSTSTPTHLSTNSTRSAPAPC